MRHRAKRFLAALKPGGKALAVAPGGGAAGELVVGELEVGHECPNCHTQLKGDYCLGCGQKNISLLRPIWYLIADLTEGIISRDGKLWRTLGQILFLPGTMTRDFMDGRRARFIPPFRLYILSTLLFFVSLFLTDIAILKLEVHEGEPIDSSVFEKLSDELAHNGLFLEKVDSPQTPENPENTANPENPENTAVASVPRSPALQGIPDHVLAEIPVETQQQLAQLRNTDEELEAAQAEITAALAASGVEIDSRLERSLRRLKAIAVKKDVNIRLAPDMTPERLVALAAVLTPSINEYRAQTQTADNGVTVGDRRYSFDLKMFVDAEPSADATPLPPEAFDDQKPTLEKEIAEAEPGGIQHWVLSHAYRALDGAVRASADPRRLNASLNDWLSKAMIVLLPVFALLLRFFYWGRENNLMKQFVFSLHFHTFIFLVMTFLVISSKFWNGTISMGLFFLVGPLYLLAAMKVATQQGWFRTIFKFVMVSGIYMVILAMTVGLTLLMSFADI